MIYLHIGLAKTGTTSVQNWLVRHSDDLAQHGVFSFRNPMLSHRLAVEAIRDAERLAQPDILPIKTLRLADALQQLHGKEIAMVSSEYFSIAEPQAVKDMLGDCRVLLALRRQDRIIESGYSQEVLEWKRVEPIGPPCYHPVYDWNLLTQAWSAVFGDKLHIRLYDEQRRRNILIDLFEGLEVERIVAELPPPRTDTNRSIPADLLEMQRQHNAHQEIFVGSAFEVAVATTKLAAARGHSAAPPFRMDKTKARAFLECYRASNCAVAQRFFGRDRLFDETDLLME